MAITGKGDYPFRSVWLEKPGICNNAFLRKAVMPGHGTDTATNTAWADWFFGTPIKFNRLIILQAVNRGSTY